MLKPDAQFQRPGRCAADRPRRQQEFADQSRSRPGTLSSSPYHHDTGGATSHIATAGKCHLTPSTFLRCRRFHTLACGQNKFRLLQTPAARQFGPSAGLCRSSDSRLGPRDIQRGQVVDVLLALRMSKAGSTPSSRSAQSPWANHFTATLA